jgi:polar amino acid transport system ATP-binding protein
LRGIDLSVAPHEVICLIGASGSGKSTMLRCINLLEEVDAGRILLGSEEITAPDADVNAVRRRIGIVFQSFNLFPHMTVLRNVTLAPTRVLHTDRRVAGGEARDLLARFGLADEVTSALDPELVAEVLEVIRELAAGGMTMLIATHEMGFAKDIANRVCFLDEGVILEDGPPAQIFSEPREERTKQFLQRIVDARRM